MTIVVTGGCGFVGTALTRSLLELKSSIVLLDLNPPQSDLTDQVSFIPTDISDKEGVSKAFEKCTEISCVFHVAGFGLAGTTNLPAYNKRTFKVNVNGTQKIIEACVQFNVKALGKLIFVVHIYVQH